MMSDFTSEFWSVYVIVFTLLGIIFCAFLLVAMGRKNETKKQQDAEHHVWDGDLAENNNPLPNWWYIMFWGLLIFVIGYLIYYPGLGSFQGVGKWSSIGQFEEEMSKIDAKTKPLYDRYLAMDVQQVAHDPEAMGMAERLFLNNCAQCHGSDARGAIGFPNLRSGVWNWGGTPEAIQESIADGRTGVMTPYGDVFDDKGLDQVTAYVRSLSGLKHDDHAAAAGKPLFEENCTACHGDDAKGTEALGAPNLTDDVWVYGSSEHAIRKGIKHGHNVEMTEGTQAMPEHHELDAGKVHLLTAYVWGLTN